MLLLLPSLLFVFSLLIILFLMIPRNNMRVRKPIHHHPPGPPKLPFIGNLHQFDTTNTHEYLWGLSKTYGPIMFMKLGCVPTIVISSARLAKEVLKTHDAIFGSRPRLTAQQKLSYNGSDIAFSPTNDDYFREMRKICALHLFSPRRVESFRPIREDEVSLVVRKISGLASSGQVVNLSKIVMGLTTTLIGRVAFGKRYDDEGLERRRFDEICHEAERLLGTFLLSDYFPSSSVLGLGWIDKLTGKMSMLENKFKELDSFYQELIDEHLSPDRPPSMEGDIIDILLQLMRLQESSSLHLTLDHIKAVLMDLFLAGSDPAAATIIWCMTTLIKEPQIMRRVQEEIRGTVGKKDLVDEGDIKKLPYFIAVVKETLRLYSPTPLLVQRETMERCILDGYEIQPKTLVFVNAWAIARDSDYWENPHEFFPERFLDDYRIDFRGQDFGFIPFGSGRRMCPGLSMGVATLELSLANLLYRFDWELPPGMKKADVDTHCKPGLTMHKKTSLCLAPKIFA